MTEQTATPQDAQERALVGAALASYAVRGGGYTTPETELARAEKDLGHPPTLADLERLGIPLYSPPVTIPAPTTEPAWAVVDSQSDRDLVALHQAHDRLKAEADAAAERLEDVKAQLKAAIGAAAPAGATKIELQTPGCTPLQLTYSEGFRFDSKRLKAADPETYVRFAVKTGSWRLASARRGPGGGE